MKRAKQLIEQGIYPAPDDGEEATCPDCGKRFSVWQMSQAHVQDTPYDEKVLVCDACYEQQDKYDSRSTIVHVRTAFSEPRE